MSASKIPFNGIKKRAALLLAALFVFLLFVTPVFAADIPAHTDNFYVNDFSGVLSAETKQYIMDANLALYPKTGAQAVVVTVDTLNGTDVESFSTELFRAYGIGSKEKNNGVLLLVVTKDRDLRIEVGYGLEGAINDAKSGRILDDYVIPYLADDKWDEGVKNGFAALVKEIKTEYGLTDEDVAGTEPAKYVKEKEPELPFLERWDGRVIVAMGISLAYGLLIGAVCPNRSFLAAQLWLVPEFVWFWANHGGFIAFVALFGCSVFALIGWAVTSPPLPGSSGGGGYSSGSSSRSYRSSSSGSSHSSHSGGGGSSGGGGASRKF